jgi:hypothetical protein
VVVGDDAPPQETISITAITENKISDRDNDLPIFLLLYHVKECRSNLIIHILLFMYNIIQISHRIEAERSLLASCGETPMSKPTSKPTTA